MSKILDELECARIRNFCQTVPTLEWPSERVHCLLDTIDQLRADLDAMTARAELAEHLRDNAIAESNRTSQKWMDGIDAAVGMKLNYHSPFTPGGMTLDGFIDGLKARAETAERVRRKLAVIASSSCPTDQCMRGVEYESCADHWIAWATAQAEG